MPTGKDPTAINPSMENVTPPSIKEIAQQSGKKILATISTAGLITCGVIPVAIIFRFNPYLSNEKFNHHPQETTKYLLMTAVPACLFLYHTTSYFYYASFCEGKLNLQGGVISRKQAIIIAFSCIYYHLNTFLSVIAYPLVLHLATYVMPWETFMFFSLHCVAATMNISFGAWVCCYHGTRILISQTILNKAKILDASKIQFKKFGIMKKDESKRKQSKLRVIKLSFLLAIPFLLSSIFLFFFGGATRYMFQESKLKLIINCSFILLMKVCIQACARKVFAGLGKSVSESFIYVSTFGCTILIDCPIRIIFSQIESSVNFILVTSAVGVAEICFRCASILLAIRKTKPCSKLYNVNKEADGWERRKKAKRNISLLMLEVDADMASEYVAIMSSFMLNCFFGHYVGFLVGKNSTYDLYKQVLYFIVQFLVEILVDFISYALESHHPLIREIMTESVPPSRFAVITGNLNVGIFCMLVLILIMAY